MILIGQFLRSRLFYKLKLMKFYTIFRKSDFVFFLIIKMFHHLQYFFRMSPAKQESPQLEVHFTFYIFRNNAQSQMPSLFCFCLWVNFLSIMPILLLKILTSELLAIAFSTQWINVIFENPIDKRNL